MTVAQLRTDAELGELLGGLSVDEVRRLCRDRGWPCVRPKRSIWLFTDAHVEQIVAMETKKPKAKPSGVSASRLPGQTARSARRSA